MQQQTDLIVRKPALELRNLYEEELKGLGVRDNAAGSQRLPANNATLSSRKWHVKQTSERQIMVMMLMCVLVLGVKARVAIAIDCTSVPNSDGNPSIDGISCTCNPLYTWDGIDACSVDCTLDPNAAAPQFDGTCP